MSESPGLDFRLVLEPERDPSPTDVGDVFQSIDDAFRLAEWIADLDSDPRALDWQGALWRLRDYDRSSSPLVVNRFQFGSPLDLVAEIPWAAVGTGSVWFFVVQIERLWNMPRRIRVEAATLATEEQRQKRELWEERLAALALEEEYWSSRRGGTGARHGRLHDRELYAPAFRGVRGEIRDADS